MELFKYFKEKFAISNEKKESYYENGKWRKSRCRINPKFFPNVIYDYLFSNASKKDICELYLKLTRDLENNNNQYKLSHSMDSNAIINWFHIKRNNKDSINAEYDEIMFVIKKYISEIINNECNVKDIIDRWNEYYNADEYLGKNKTYEDIIADFSNYDMSVIECDKIKKKIFEYNPRINISVPSKDNNKLKAIGDIGEKI